jgi:glycerol-3-phosphate dehydrogenase
MAKQAVDRVVEREGREAPCRTEQIPLGMPVDPGELPAVEGVDRESVEHLASRYGYAAFDVLEHAGESAELAQRIVPGLPDLVAEAAFAVRREQAASLADALLRRTRLGLLAARELCGDSGGAEAAARAMGAELGWDEAQVVREVEAWREVARAEGLVPGLEPVEEAA